MKRITAFLLSLVMTSFSIIFVNAETTVNSTNKDEWRLLLEIGVLDNQDITELEQNKTITRAEYIDKIIKAMNMKDRMFEKKVVFSDVTEANTYYSSIMIAYQLGIINGYGGKFRPTDMITSRDALVIALRALGYEQPSQTNGGYSIGYNSMALSIGFDNIGSENEVLTLDTMCNIFYDMLNIPMLEQQASTYKMEQGETMLNRYFDIYKVNGLVTSNTKTALGYGDAYNEKYICINKEYYKTSNKNEDDYLGFNVELFYHLDESDEKTVVCILEHKNDVIRVDAEDLILNQTDETKISYYNDNNKQKSIKLGLNTKFIFNGKALDINTQYSNSVFDINDGYIEAIDNNRDSEYDVVHIWSFKHIVFSTYNAEDELIYDLLVNRNNVSLEEKDYIVLNEEGEQVDLTALKKYDILSVAESKDGEFIKIIVSYNRVTGKIDAVNNENSETKVEINGQEYLISAEALSSKDVELDIGVEGTFYLSVSGQIVYRYALDDDRGLLGILQNLILSEDDETTVYVKMFTSGGVKESYTFAEKVNVDGKVKKSAAAYKELLDGKVQFTPILVRYNLDEKNQISLVDTEKIGENESAYSLHKIRAREDAALTYKSWPQSFGSKFYKNGSPIFFGVPENYDNGIDYDAFATVTLTNDYRKQLELYAIGDNPVAYDVGVVFGDYSMANATIKNGAKFSVVKSISQEYKDGEVFYKVTFYEKAAEIDKYVRTEDAALLNDIEPGDVVRYGTNHAGYIGAIQMVYDYSEGTFPLADANGLYTNGSEKIFSGKVLGKHGNYITLSMNPEAELTDAPYAFPISSSYTYLLTKDKKVISFLPDEVKDYARFGNDAYSVLTSTLYDEIQSGTYFIFIEH